MFQALNSDPLRPSDLQFESLASFSKSPTAVLLSKIDEYMMYALKVVGDGDSERIGYFSPIPDSDVLKRSIDPYSEMKLTKCFEQVILILSALELKLSVTNASNDSFLVSSAQKLWRSVSNRILKLFIGISSASKSSSFLLHLVNTGGSGNRFAILVKKLFDYHQSGFFLNSFQDYIMHLIKNKGSEFYISYFILFVLSIMD